jgi:adenylyltransferase/sulfurtransferase
MSWNLSPEQYLRYSRHLILPEVGLEGQKKLLQAKVLLIGAGGLGSPLGLYLAAAGVGTIGIVDPDVVDESNLQRQVLHSTDEVGRPKVESAERRLRALNPDVQVRAYPVKLTSENALQIFEGYDIVIDGTDNFATRYLVNDACVLTGKTNVYGSIFRFEGQATVFKPGAGPCYRCLYPEPPPPGMVPSCAEGGVLGILPGIVGNIQALEAIKQILGVGESLVGRLVLFNALSFRFRELRIRRDPSCPVCGDKPTVQALIDYNEFCGLPAEEKKREFDPEAEIRTQELHRRLLNDEDLLLLDVREPAEWQIAHIKGAELIPVGELPMRWQEIAEFKDRPVVTYCHKGMRSLRALKHLRSVGFSDVKSLYGGVDAWASEIEPDLARY